MLKMTSETQILHEDLECIKQELRVIKHILTEDFELSNWAINELEKARQTPKSEYVSQKKVEKEFLS